MTQAEIVQLINETAAGLAEKFLIHDRVNDPLLRPGMIEEAIRSYLTGPSLLAGIFDQKIREMIPVEIPILEGVIVNGDSVQVRETTPAEGTRDLPGVPES